MAALLALLRRRSRRNAPRRPSVRSVRAAESADDRLYARIEADYGYPSPVYGESPGPLSYRRVGRIFFPGFQFEVVGERFGRVRQVVLDLLGIAEVRRIASPTLLRWLVTGNDNFYGGRPADSAEPEHVAFKFRREALRLPQQEVS